MPHIFISYAKKDTRALAGALLDSLVRIPGVTAWMDRALEADESWAAQIMEEIDACDYFVVLLSPDVNRPVTPDQRRSFVLNEIDYAQQLEQHKPILPVMAMTTRMPVQIAGVQYIDLTATPTDPAPIVERICARFGLLAPTTSSPNSAPVSAHTPSDSDEAEAQRLLDSRWSGWDFKGDDVGAKADLDAAFVHSRGVAKRMLGDYKGAIADFDEALRAKPDSAFVLRSRGDAKRMLSDYPAALDDFNRSIDLDPQSAIALQARGEVKRLMGDYTGAIADFDEALRIEPDSAVTLRVRGDAKRNVNDFSGALADLDAALLIEPRSAFALASRARAKLQLGDFAGWLADLNAAKDLEPK